MGWELDEAYEGVKRFIPQKEMVSLAFFLYGGYDFYFAEEGRGVDLQGSSPPFIYKPRVLCRMRPGVTAHRAFHQREISVV